MADSPLNASTDSVGSKQLKRSTLAEEKPLSAPHSFKLVHFHTLTWCQFCTKFIWGLGYQGHRCSACKYAVHPKCLALVPANCPNQKPIKDPNSKKNISRAPIENFKDLVEVMRKGIEIKDRKALLKSFPNSFTGKDAIDWFITNLPIRDREEGIEFGGKLVQHGYVRSYDAAASKFKDSSEAYYSFEDSPQKLQELPSQDSEASLDDFEVLNVIGQGGFGRVVRVERKENKKVFAMKIMNKSKISGQRQLQCLIAEKNIMLNDNPFLVHLHYSFATDDKLYFVMDYIPGGDLAFHLGKKKRFNEKEIKFIAAEIVLAIEHLHSCGIIYRDLKLENVLLDKDGHVCLTDFGLSKELESISATTKTVCGTPTYLAPEVLLGQPYGGAIDWWSLGVVLYELFTGMNPFDAKEFDTVLNNIMSSPIVVPEYVPPTGKDLIEKLLQRHPAKRLCSGPSGSDEIQTHPFFKTIDWKKLMVKDAKAPYVPKAEEFAEDFKDETSIEPPKGNGANPGLQFVDFQYAKKSVV